MKQLKKCDQGQSQIYTVADIQLENENITKLGAAIYQYSSHITLLLFCMKFGYFQEYSCKDRAAAAECKDHHSWSHVLPIIFHPTKEISKITLYNNLPMCKIWLPKLTEILHIFYTNFAFNPISINFYLLLKSEKTNFTKVFMLMILIQIIFITV